MNRPPISHGCWDIELQILWGHNLDHLRSCDVIWDLTIGLAIWGFLYVVNLNRLSISHGFLDIKLQWYWSHNRDLSWPRDVISHVTIGLSMCRFPIGSLYGSLYEPTMYVARLSRYWASKISGSRPWPYWVTWRHLSCDHRTPDMRFPRWSFETIALSRIVVEILCQTLSQAYSHLKCTDPHLSVLDGKIEGYSILQLCAYSRSLGASFIASED